MLKKDKKGIITVLMCFTISMVIVPAQIVPNKAIYNTARAMEEYVNTKTESSFTPTPTPTIPIKNDNSKYKLINDSKTWKEAKAYCEQLGGHLATITSEDEQQIIENLLETEGEKHCYWIGGYKENNQWKWITEESFDYSNWDHGEPNDYHRNEYYIEIYGIKDKKYELGKWNDTSNEGDNVSSSYHKKEYTGFICEWDKDAHIFTDYNYNNPVTDDAPIIYGNGKTQTIDGKKVNNKVCTVYTDILASYKYTVNSKNIVKPAVGKVIVGVTKSDTKPEVSNKNKITDISASKIARAKIKNGQITVTAVGKESGTVYLWVIDTGNKGVSACCPIDVKLAPKKLEVQDTAGSKLKNTKLANGNTLEVCVAGLVGSAKTDDCTYTATVDSKYQSYITVTPVDGSTNKFTIKATGLKNNKDTKASVTFKCDQNGKKTNFSLTITK